MRGRAASAADPRGHAGGQRNHGGVRVATSVARRCAMRVGTVRLRGTIECRRFWRRSPTVHGGVRCDRVDAFKEEFGCVAPCDDRRTRALALAPAARVRPDRRRRSRPPAAAPAAARSRPQPEADVHDATAGMLLVQIKPDQTAAFEEMIGKLKAGAREDATTPVEAAGRGLEGLQGVRSRSGGNALYVVRRRSGGQGRRVHDLCRCCTEALPDAEAQRLRRPRSCSRMLRRPRRCSAAATGSNLTPRRRRTST